MSLKTAIMILLESGENLGLSCLARKVEDGKYTVSYLYRGQRQLPEKEMFFISDGDEVTEEFPTAEAAADFFLQLIP